MIEKIKYWDEQLFLLLNSKYHDGLDPLVHLFTQTWPWIPMYLVLVFLLVKTYKTESWWMLIAVILTITFADQFTSSFMKPFFERLRPCHDPRWAEQIHHYGSCSSLFGFASSHAANSFGVATIMTIFLYKKIVQVRWLFIWACLFSYTRIYLGVHYPGDIFVGALVGIMSALVAYKIAKFLRPVTYYLFRKKETSNQ
jgi:undecaprenyl-diphosphatase